MGDRYTTNSDYVDVHGRSLNILVRNDGTLYIPFNEIRKAGYHIFPKSNFVQNVVSKKIIMEEFQLYLQGAGREFLIQRDISNVSHGDIQKQIEECRNNLTASVSTSQPEKSPSGLLGRTLLRNPVEVSTSLNQQESIKSENFGGSNRTNNRTNSRSNNSEPVNALRRPHQQNDNPTQTNFGTDDHNGRPSNIKAAALKRNRQKQVNQSQQNEQNNYSYNNGKNAQRRDSESKSTSGSEDNGQQQYIKLSNLKLKRIELKPVTQDVKVVHKEVFNEKIKYWVQLVENDQIVLDIIEKCYELSDDAAIVKPKMNEMFLAQNKDDDLWYRVIVFRVSPVVKVHFLDFGNDSVVSELRVLPEELKAIPAQAVRICLSNTSSQTEHEVEDIFSVRFIKQYEDTTCVVEKTDRKPQKPLEPVFMDKIKYSTKLTDKDVVKIVSHCDGKLYLRNKEHHEKLVEVDIEIKHFKRELVNKVDPGQVVLSKKEGSEEKLCRAIVKKVKNNIATVHFMDYHIDDDVPINSLYGVNKSIANLPATLLESPVLKGFSIDRFDDNAASILDEMVANQVKFNVSHGAEFDLFIKDKSLSQLIFPEIKKKQTSPQPNKVPKTTTSQNTVAENKYVRVMYEHMQNYEPPMGKGDYMLTNFKDCSDFTVTSTEDNESDMLSRCTSIDVTDTEPYEPEDSEMVLANFDDGWYRALVLDVSESGTYQILFVEYGNIVEVTKKDIRQFPEEFKKIPILGLSCQMIVDDTEEVKNKLEKLLEVDNIYEMNFLSYSVDNLQYTVEIPKIKEILKQGSI